MPIISIEKVKILDQRERCDTMCVVMWWSNSEV